MCAKCHEIEQRIEHLRQLAGNLMDQQVLDGIASLIADLEAQKITLHPEPPNK